MCSAISSKIICSKPTKMCEQNLIKSRMSYSESELDSNFVINSSESDSESEFDFNSEFINLDICIFFLLYTCTL